MRNEFTEVPNVFFDKILKQLTGSETKVLLTLFRETHGKQRRNVKKSLTQLTYLTGLSISAVSTSIHSLVLKGYVTIVRNPEQAGNHYEVTLEL